MARAGMSAGVCVAALLLLAAQAAADQCPEGQTWNECGSACPLTCDNPNPVPCMMICMPKCECPSGLLMDGDKCVALSDCKTQPSASPSPASSGKSCTHNGKVYKDGESFKDDCNSCGCSDGVTICTEMACMPSPSPSPSSATERGCNVDGVLHAEGSSFKSDCNTCHCNNGMAMCTKMACTKPTEPATTGCASVVCDAGQHCEETKVECFTTPCNPVTQCVPDTDPTKAPDCSTMTCPTGQTCVETVPNCLASLSTPCTKLATCVPIAASASPTPSALPGNPCDAVRCAGPPEYKKPAQQLVIRQPSSGSCCAQYAVIADTTNNNTACLSMIACALMMPACGKDEVLIEFAPTGFIPLCCARYTCVPLDGKKAGAYLSAAWAPILMAKEWAAELPTPTNSLVQDQTSTGSIPITTPCTQQLCPLIEIVCPKGNSLVSTKASPENGQCCPTYSCVPSSKTVQPWVVAVGSAGAVAVVLAAVVGAKLRARRRKTDFFKLEETSTHANATEEGTADNEDDVVEEGSNFNVVLADE